MLKVFDQNHNPVGMLVRYNDLQITSDVETGDKKMTFNLTGKPDVPLDCEYYLQTRTDEFVLKKTGEKKKGTYEAILNLETLTGTPYDAFSIANESMSNGIALALDGTGWSLGICEVDDEDKRNAGMIDCDALKVIMNLCAVWMVEPEFDTLNKKVNIYKKRGSDKGCYFVSGLNLVALEKESDSYDFYTVMIPRGADGLDITEVNDGKNYIENHQYSDKRLVMIYKDESYTDPQALLDDSVKYLDELSQPYRCYKCEVIDLAKQSYTYSVLSYKLGDIVTIIDVDTRTRVKQRIVGITEYPQKPWKNTCEMQNRAIKFTDMQSKIKNAESISVYEVEDGILTGTVTLSQILKKLKQ